MRGSGALLTLYVVALFLPPALIPQFQMILSLGLYNTRPGYILLFLVNPIGLIILVNYIKSIPIELDQQAAVDGCGYVRFIFTVLFPLIRPAVATVTVLHAIGIWNELILATIYLTNDDLYPITRGLIVFEGVYGSDWPALAAAVLMLMLPMLRAVHVPPALHHLGADVGRGEGMSGVKLRGRGGARRDRRRPRPVRRERRRAHRRTRRAARRHGAGVERRVRRRRRSTGRTGRSTSAVEDGATARRSTTRTVPRTPVSRTAAS